MPAFDEIMNLSDFFKVMGDSTRLQLLLSLQQSEMCVSDLANVLDMTKSAVSHQLKALRLSKLIKSRKEGKTVYYSLDDEHIETILGMAFDHTKAGMFSFTSCTNSVFLGLQSQCVPIISSPFFFIIVE